MKKRRPSSRVDPRDQFSKKLARWSSWFWFLYMLLTLAAVVIQPLSADAAVYLAGFSSVVMVLNIAAYTHNSVYDKAIAAGAKIVGRFHFSWKPVGAGDSDFGGSESDGTWEEGAGDSDSGPTGSDETWEEEDESDQTFEDEEVVK